MIQKNQISNNLWNSRTYFMYQKQDSIYRESIRSVSGSKCTPRRFFIKYGSGCFYPLEDHSLQERTYIR